MEKRKAYFLFFSIVLCYISRKIDPFLPSGEKKDLWDSPVRVRKNRFVPAPVWEGLLRSNEGSNHFLQKRYGRKPEQTGSGKKGSRQGTELQKRHTEPDWNVLERTDFVWYDRITKNRSRIKKERRRYAG